MFNKAMSEVRAFVEGNYKSLKQKCTRNDFARSLKIRQSPTRLFSQAADLLLNARTRVYKGGHVGCYFACKIPDLEEYESSL